MEASSFPRSGRLGWTFDKVSKSSDVAASSDGDVIGMFAGRMSRITDPGMGSRGDCRRRVRRGIAGGGGGRLNGLFIWARRSPYLTRKWIPSLMPIATSTVMVIAMISAMRFGRSIVE